MIISCNDHINVNIKQSKVQSMILRCLVLLTIARVSSADECGSSRFCAARVAEDEEFTLFARSCAACVCYESVADTRVTLRLGEHTRDW